MAGWGADIAQSSAAMGFLDSVVNYEQTIRNYGTAVTVGVFIGSAITTGAAFGIATYWFVSKELIGKVMGQVTTQAKALLPVAMSALRGRPLASEPGDVGADDAESDANGDGGGGDSGGGGGGATDAATASPGASPSGEAGAAAASGTHATAHATPRAASLQHVRAQLARLEGRVRALEAAATAVAAAAAAGNGSGGGGAMPPAAVASAAAVVVAAAAGGAKTNTQKAPVRSARARGLTAKLTAVVSVAVLAAAARRSQGTAGASSGGGGGSGGGRGSTSSAGMSWFGGASAAQ